MSAPTIQELARKPFSSASAGSNAAFWAAYCEARPSPTEDFLRQILAYHAAHSDRRDVVHDVGTGPGNIAGRLAPYFAKVIASDINESALEAGPDLLPVEYRDKVFFIKSSAEDLASTAQLPAGTGVGDNDLIIVTECMPLLDREKSLEAFNLLLRPSGTLAIYFYGRPIFADGNADACNAVYERLTSRVCRFFHPFKGSPGEPFHRRSAETLFSFLDNIPVPPSQWADVERHKWNTDRPMIFNGKEGYDFDLEYVDRRTASEKTVEIRDRDFWSESWDLQRVREYVASNYPKHDVAAGDSLQELDSIYEELAEAMGGHGAVRKISFPVCLILARKR